MRIGKLDGVSKYNTEGGLPRIGAKWYPFPRIVFLMGKGFMACYGE